jgi:hypothetical protein
MRIPPTRIATAAIICALVIAGCGGNDGDNSTAASNTAPVVGPTVPVNATPTTVDTRADDKGRLTTGQALTLSQMLLKNEQAKGAMAEIFVPFGTAATFTLRGPVDWANDRGSFTMATKRSDNVVVPDSTVVWDRGAMLTELEGLETAMEAKGRTGVVFVQRPLDAKGVSLDQLVTFVGSLAVDRAENPLLLRQGDTAFLGSKTIDGVALDGYRFGKTRYFIDPSTGLLRRVEARFTRYDEPVIITLSNHGPQTVTVPPPSAVVDAAAVPELVKQLTTQGP